MTLPIVGTDALKVIEPYSTELLNVLINLAIKDAIAREESYCRKCFP
jgi:hypothetical protein